MATEQYEIEIKCLLGTPEEADRVRNGLRTIDPMCACQATQTQLNHYFEGGELSALADRLSPRLSDEDKEKLSMIANRAAQVSVRTRAVNGEARFVVKASLREDSSANGVARAELDVVMPGMSLDALDSEILAAGYRYQAKWSRSREEYQLGPVAVCLDKNAGYGYLAEFEKVVESEEEIAAAEAELRALMQELGVEELPQDRLERMFAYYNEHWPEYYGTENIFTIK